MSFFDKDSRGHFLLKRAEWLPALHTLIMFLHCPVWPVRGQWYRGHRSRSTRGIRPRGARV